jgi:hypothetical protein
LQKLFNMTKHNGLIVFCMKMCQIKIWFLGYIIYYGLINPISRSIEFANKFSNEIKEKT